ncbi:MAG: acyl carrier protein [Candidatus Thiodiazotropha sp.]
MSVESKIRSFILDNFIFSDDDDALKNEDSFLDNGILDSTGILEVIFFLDEEFSIKVNDDELIPENLDSVDRLAAFIKRKTQ